MADEISIKVSQEAINNELRSLYQKNSSKLKKLVQDYEGASCPHLLFIPSSYLSCKNKLLVVGQQTNGWGCSGLISCCSDIVVPLMKEYEEFNLGENYVSSPFWQAGISLNRLVNPNSPERSFLWTNLVKIDQNGRRPVVKELEDTVTSFKLLQSEIEITKPNVVIFFTGPDYDALLQSSFPGIIFTQIKKYNTKAYAKLSLKGSLPELSFRTYHPKYLKLSGKWEILNELKDEILKEKKVKEKVEHQLV